MTPTSTLYRLKEPKDVQAIRRMWEKSRLPKHATVFPEIVAERDGKVIGFLGTLKVDNAVVAGPLLLNGKKQKAFTFLRLVEAYDRVLFMAGVKSYLFAIPEKMTEYQRLAEKIGLVPFTVDADGDHWYERRISE